MTDLTVVILTKNEEKNLRKCVESFRGVAKRFVIVVALDTVARKHCAKNLMQSFRKLVRGWTFIKINGCLTQTS